ncbi:MAG TPA: acyl-CoA dehydrogenase family protein [Xanthobacteraceae bacterium]|jgi:pimeloyl-CoA dehydrogenase small subunit|nr:acyl-CoA dehydrogenase family protein [Xanthobacteraceae bacterium]
MDFELSEEQRLLADSVDRLFADHYGFEARQNYMQAAEGWSRPMWARYAELGLIGLRFDEDYGGFGGGPVETMIVAQACGRALVLEPFLATVVLGGGLLKSAGTKDQCAALLPKIAAGELILAFAHAERQARYNFFDIATSARRDGSSWILDGGKSLVLHGDSADKIIVSARVSGQQRDRDGLGLFLVDTKTDGVARRSYQTIDGLRAAEISLKGVRVEPGAVLGETGNAAPVIDRVIDEAIASLAAEAVGAMDVMHETTIDYLRTRRQFGVPIGNFQVLQHRSADMLIALEQARSMAMLATMMSDEPNAQERRKAMSAAKVQIGRSGRFIGQQAVQLHGGIGMTMEYKLGHYFKRVTAIDTLFGDADHHLGLVARSGGLVEVG